MTGVYRAPTEHLQSTNRVPTERHTPRKLAHVPSHHFLGNDVLGIICGSSCSCAAQSGCDELMINHDGRRESIRIDFSVRSGERPLHGMTNDWSKLSITIIAHYAHSAHYPHDYPHYPHSERMPDVKPTNQDQESAPKAKRHRPEPVRRGSECPAIAYHLRLARIGFRRPGALPACFWGFPEPNTTTLGPHLLGRAGSPFPFRLPGRFYLPCHVLIEISTPSRGRVKVTNRRGDRYMIHDSVQDGM